MKKTIPILLALLVFTVGTYSQNATKQRHADNVLYVKLKDDLSGSDIQKVTTTGAGHWKKVHAVPAETLQKYREDAAAKFGKKIPDPNSEFYFYPADVSQLTAIKAGLEKNTLIDRVNYVPILINSNAPDYFTSQTYLHASNSGINAEAVWTTYGSRGTGVKLCDIEYLFNATHNDLPSVTILGPAPVDPFSGAGESHGTAVLGEIASLNDGNGTTGIATDCDIYFAGAYDGVTYDVAAAITNAMTTLSAGDVILLEQQIDGPNYTGSTDQFGLVPVEWYESFYDAIVLATAQGITVVEAAGNGQQDLDDPIYSVDNGGHYPFLAGNNSGAIIVGAGAVAPTFGGTDVARSRLWYSNYGSRVNVQGNGEAVYTTGYGDLYAAEGVDKYYTADFGGTSGASPIVTGAAILLQSVYKTATGTSLTPDEVRTYLINSGQAQQTGDYPSSQHIGPLPNIYIAIQTALAATGIDKISANEMISVYPNPANGNFNISSGIKNVTDLYVVNALGEKIRIPQTMMNANSQLSLDLSGEPKGMYFIHCITGSESVVKKIVIQ